MSLHTQLQGIAAFVRLPFARDGHPLPWTVLDDDDAPRALAVRPRHVVSHGKALRDAAVGG